MTTNGRLDVLLVNPGNRRQVYQVLADDLAAIEPPVWVGLIATYVRTQGLSVHILEANAEGLSPEEAAQRAVDINPVLTAVIVYGQQPSASTQTMPAAGDFCRAYKQLAPDRPVIMVGGHVASLPERTLQEEATDFVSSGEGPVTVVELAQALKSNETNLRKVHDLWFLEDGKIRRGPAAPLIRDIEGQMKGMAWDLLPMHLYRAHNWQTFGNLARQPYASMYTSLGCPFHCSFCCIQAPFKSGEAAAGFGENVNTYRYWSTPTVLDQIGYLVEKHGVRNFKFADEMFVLNPRHVATIAEGIVERGYDLNIWAYARVDTVRDDMVDKLKAAGFNWLAFGLESGSDRVRDGVDKRFEQDEIYHTLKKVRSAGINVVGNYIFGLPDDDMETMQQTLDLALDLNVEWGNFYSAMAYPGSQLYDFAVQQGWKLPPTWSGYSQHAVDTLPLPTKYLTAGEVLKFRDEAFLKYHTHPNYLAMIRQKFGEPTVEHIKDMASHRLVRNNI